MTIDNYQEMSAEELNAKLEALKDDLADAEDLREMQLGQEGHHISSTGLVGKFDAMEGEIKEKIAIIEKALEGK